MLSVVWYGTSSDYYLLLVFNQFPKFGSNFLFIAWKTGEFVASSNTATAMLLLCMFLPNSSVSTKKCSQKNAWSLDRC